MSQAERELSAECLLRMQIVTKLYFGDLKKIPDTFLGSRLFVNRVLKALPKDLPRDSADSKQFTRAIYKAEQSTPPRNSYTNSERAQAVFDYSSASATAAECETKFGVSRSVLVRASAALLAASDSKKQFEHASKIPTAKSYFRKNKVKIILNFLLFTC